MKRRHIFLAIGSATGVGGYLWVSRSSVDPEPLPDRPSNLTAKTVTSYVEEYEVTVRRNEHVQSADTEFSMACNSRVDRTVDELYMVIVSCAGSMDTTGITGASHHDLRTPATTYIVDTESTTRFEWVGYRSSRGSADREPVLRCANFMDADQTVSIAVTPHNGTPDPVFRESITVPGERDETIETVVDDYGTYDVTARLGDDTTETYEWEYTEDTAEDSIGVGVYIMPDGTIDIDRLETEQR